MREVVGALGGWKGDGVGGSGGAGVICVYRCAKTQNSCCVCQLTPEYNLPNMMAVMKRCMTLRKIDRDKGFCSYTVMYNVLCICFIQIQWNLNSRG